MAAHVDNVPKRFSFKQPVWKALEAHYRRIRDLHLRELFLQDPFRGERMSAEGAGIYLDYSKNRVTDHTVKLLIRLAEESGLPSRIDAMFRGEKVNITEKRAALHIALRAPEGACIFVDGENVVPVVHAALGRMTTLCNRVRSGEWKGHTGKPIHNVVNIGVGGSDLAPIMTYEALKSYCDTGLRFRFVSNVDAEDLFEAIRDLDPSETLFILQSEAFTTIEARTNACTARSWVIDGFGGDERSVGRHFVAITANGKEASRFGIERTGLFDAWDWVGGRYAMESANGLSTMLAVGPNNFRSMLQGFHEMDMHFLTCPYEHNLPVLMGLLAVWYNNFFGAQTLAIIPYDQALRRFPDYLQHLAMTSNGKRVTLIGTEVTQTTCPIYWGQSGTNAQYSFSQLLHQGTMLIPCDFIGFAKSRNSPGLHHDILMANLFAQTEALAFGNTPADVQAEGTPDWLVPHRLLEGNRPSNTVLAERLTPVTLGKLVALYEHSVFTQGVIWNINSFDQWGLNLGTALAERIVSDLESTLESQNTHDSSTSTLIRRYRKLRVVEAE